MGAHDHEMLRRGARPLYEGIDEIEGALAYVRLSWICQLG
jgi:hypothetical protein